MPNSDYTIMPLRLRIRDRESINVHYVLGFRIGNVKVNLITRICGSIAQVAYTLLVFTCP